SCRRAQKLPALAACAADRTPQHRLHAAHPDVAPTVPNAPLEFTDSMENSSVATSAPRPPSANSASAVSASYTLHGAVAVIRFENPPMNTLALAMRSAVHEHIGKAGRDAAVSAVVLIGGGRAF